MNSQNYDANGCGLYVDLVKIMYSLCLSNPSNHLRPTYLWCYEHMDLHLVAPVDVRSYFLGRLS